MKLTRTLKRFISLAMIGMLFFAQMAIAAYVCPVQRGTASGQHQVFTNQMPTRANMPGCESMDKVTMDTDSPSLCHASCHSAEQSDQTSTTKLPIATLSSLSFVVLPATPVALLGRVVLAGLMQSVGASPPLSVLYCCFRI